MKPPHFAYVRPRSLAEALELLSDGLSQPIAGGQSLVPAMNFRLAVPKRLVDLAHVPELRGLTVDAEGGLVAGAMTRHRDFETDPRVRASWPLLSHAMDGVAHIPIRNRGTIGGSLAHADPSADWPALCLASKATMILVSPDGEREVPADDFSLGLFSTAIESGELLLRVRFPAWPASRRFGLQKMTRRHGDFAIAGVVCVLDLDAVGRCQAPRLVLQGLADMPLRAAAAEALLLGQVPDAERIAAAAAVAGENVELRDDMHASAAYRAQLVQVLTRRALAQAVGTAGPTT